MSSVMSTGEQPFGNYFGRAATVTTGRGIADNPVTRPRAWLIVDRQEDVKQDFTISDSYLTISRNVAEAADSSALLKTLTPADKAIRAIGSNFNVDPIGGEHFWTVLDTGFENGAQASLHYMLLERERGGQKYHYHPPDRNYPASSVRHVLLYGLHNRKTDDRGGITFSWFNTKDTEVIHPEDQDYSYTRGKPVGEKHKLYVRPGQIVLLQFGKGVHRFSGDALAMSAHFLDTDSKAGRHGSFLDNTSGWRGDKPEERRNDIQLSNGGHGKAIFKDTLTEIFTRHTQIWRRCLEAHAGAGIDKEQPVTAEQIEQVVADLRY